MDRKIIIERCKELIKRLESEEEISAETYGLIESLMDLLSTLAA